MRDVAHAGVSVHLKTWFCSSTVGALNVQLMYYLMVVLQPKTPDILGPDASSWSIMSILVIFHIHGSMYCWTLLSGQQCRACVFIRQLCLGLFFELFILGVILFLKLASP